MTSIYESALEKERTVLILDLFQVADALGAISSPEKEPYKQQYAARTALEKALSYVRGGDEVSHEHNVVRSRLEAKLGCIANAVEEPHLAENLFYSSLSVLVPGAETIDDAPTCSGAEYQLGGGIDRDGAIDAACTLNQAALLWDSRDQPNRARGFLESSVEISRTFGLDDLETEALFFLAQVHGKLGKPTESAHFCRLTLERQLQAAELSHDEWAKNALGLAAYYSANKRHSAAMACLTAAKLMSSACTNKKEDKIQQLLADIDVAVARCHLAVLVHEDAGRDCKQHEQGEKNDDQALLIAVQERLSTKTHENSDAPNIYLSVIEHFRLARASFESALQYYVLDGFVTEHVGIVRDISQLYSALANAEKDYKRQINLHQRRLDLLEPVRIALNAKIFADLRAALAFEIGDIASNMLDAKAKRAHQSQSTKAKLTACCRLRDLALSAYDDFATCILTDNDSKKDPALALDPEEALIYLKSRFYASRIQGRVFLDKNPVQLLKLSLGRYTDTANCAKRIIFRGEEKKPFFPDPNSFKQELAICNDMIELLPHKIQHAQNSGSVLDETLLPPNANTLPSSKSSNSETLRRQTSLQFPA